MAAVTNINDANINLATELSKQANHMDAKDAEIVTMLNLINQLQGEIKTLKNKKSGQVTKKTNTSGYKKGNWWSNPLCWTHVVGRHDVEACKLKSYGHKEKSTYLNRMGGSKKGIP